MLGIRAYDDVKTFGALPFAGGFWDQPAQLVTDMRVVAMIVKRVEKARADAAERKAK